MRSLVDIEAELPRVFTPASPIASPRFLQGRSQIIEDMKRAWNRVGSSVVLYGKRGVGKTSVVKVAARSFEGGIFYHSASNGDSFQSIAFAMLQHFNGAAQRELTPQGAAQHLPALAALIIIDDFERIESHAARFAFSELIKKLSDSGVPATMTIVGISDSIEDLIEGHESVGRHIVALPIPNLSSGEVEGIIRRGAEALGIEFEEGAVDQIARLSDSTPCYAHLLCEGAVVSLIRSMREGTKSEPVVSVREVRAAVEYAIRSHQFPVPPGAVTRWYEARKELTAL